MRLVTFLVDGAPRLGAILGERTVVDLSSAYRWHVGEGGKSTPPAGFFPSDMMGFLDGGERWPAAARETLAFAEERAAQGKLDRGPDGEKLSFDLGAVRLAPPVPRPGKLMCVGHNYRGLYIEGEPDDAFPRCWLAAQSSMIAHGEPIVRPRNVTELDYEVELAVVIGKRGKHIDREHALDYVAGYTVANDLMDVALLRRESEARTRCLQKSLDTFSPMGPWLVTKDEIEDPNDLDLELRVNGEVRQRSNTRNMVCDVQGAIAYLSQMTLEPGDIISTGTPAGCAHMRPDPNAFYLRPGDVVEAEVQGIGILRNPVVDEPGD